MMTKLRYPEPVILSVAQVIEANARNHVERFATFGITETFLNQFHAKIQQGESMPNDLANRLELKGFTVEKDRILAASYQWGKELRVRIETVFGKRSPEYAAFPNKVFSQAGNSETRLLPIFGFLISLAEKYQNELAIMGQTPAVLENGRHLLNALQGANLAQETKKVEKTVSNEERKRLFLELFETVNKISQVGKLLFKNDPPRLVLFKKPWPNQRKGKESKEGE
ncbi:hypothetical protein JW964_10835 [candidate division KSB1 bacterium]|nr:hypothetical protein [candidate division KSB1 bacterium]